MLQPLLLHIRCRDLAHAVSVWQLGQRAGLKFSTIRSIKLGSDGRPVPWGVVVELMGTERMDVPLSGLEAVELSRLVPLWTEHANGLFGRTKGKMRALLDLLEAPVGA
jgi:tRNA(Phe) wybutosine-synthesizing methylase Tyw3